MLAELHRDGLLLTRRRRRTARIVGVVGGIGALLVGTIVGVLGIVLLFRRSANPPSWPDASSPAVAGHAHSMRTGAACHPPRPGWSVALHGEVALRAGDPELAEALASAVRAPTGGSDEVPPTGTAAATTTATTAVGATTDAAGAEHGEIARAGQRGQLRVVVGGPGARPCGHPPGRPGRRPGVGRHATAGSPALAALLLERWVLRAWLLALSRRTLTATLLDLAARGYLEPSMVDGVPWLRVPGRTGDDSRMSPGHSAPTTSTNRYGVWSRSAQPGAAQPHHRTSAEPDPDEPGPEPRGPKRKKRYARSGSQRDDRPVDLVGDVPVELGRLALQLAPPVANGQPHQIGHQIGGAVEEPPRALGRQPMEVGQPARWRLRRLQVRQGVTGT